MYTIHKKTIKVGKKFVKINTGKRSNWVTLMASVNLILSQQTDQRASFQQGNMQSLLEAVKKVTGYKRLTSKKLSSVLRQAEALTGQYP